MWGGVTDLITHAKFYLNRFRSFGSPGGVEIHHHRLRGSAALL